MFAQSGKGAPMRTTHWRSAAILLILGPAFVLADRIPMIKPVPPGKLDLAGDPLPPGAYARLGSVRLRHDATHLAFLGPQTLASLGSTLRTWDMVSGKQIHESQSEHIADAQGADFSGDGRVLITLHTPPMCRVWDS